MEKLLQLKFLMFENEKNNCWLDASVALIAHNRTFKKIVNCVTDSQINKIISTHAEAVSILNDSVGNAEQRIKRTRELLTDIQNSTLLLLKQFLKSKLGEPDSAFCALLNLIIRDKSDIKEHLNVSWIWRKSCTNCGTNNKSKTYMKPIITLSKVNKFQPECPTSFYMCNCKTEQEMKLIYKELPVCLIFHFENGAGDGEDFPLSFTVNGRKYQLTCIVLLEKSSDSNLNHFITWVRDPAFNVWLDCNDLNTTIVCFSCKPPELNLKDVYMYVFESFDDLGKVKNEISGDQEQDIESCNVEVIDLSEEEPKSSSENSSCKSDSSKSFKNEKIDAPTDAVLSTKKEDGTTSESDENNAQKTHSLFPIKLIETKEQNDKSKTQANDGVIKLKSEITNISYSKNINMSESKNVNILDSKNISMSDKNKKGNFFSKICSNEKDIHCRENNADKGTIDLSSVVKNEQVLNDTLSKASDKINFITGSSNIFKKSKEDHSLSDNKNKPQSNVKESKVQKSELGSANKIKKDKQSTRNKSILHDSLKYSDVESSNSMQQLEKDSLEIASVRQEDENNSNSSVQNMKLPKSETILDGKKLSGQKQKVLTEQQKFSSTNENSANINGTTVRGSSPKCSGLMLGDHQTPKIYAESEEKKICEYDESKLQLRMQRTSLKRTDSVDSSKRKKGKIANPQNSTMIDDVVSKTSESLSEVPKVNKRKNFKKNDEETNQSNELSINEDSKNIEPKPKKRKSAKKNEETTNQSYGLSGDTDKTNETNLLLEEKLQRYVNAIVEPTFVAFLKQVCIGHERMSL